MKIINEPVPRIQEYTTHICNRRTAGAGGGVTPDFLTSRSSLVSCCAAISWGVRGRGGGWRRRLGRVENAIHIVPAAGAGWPLARTSRRLLFYARRSATPRTTCSELGVLALSRAVADGCSMGGGELHGIGTVQRRSGVAAAVPRWSCSPGPIISVAAKRPRCRPGANVHAAPEPGSRCEMAWAVWRSPTASRTTPRAETDAPQPHHRRTFGAGNRRRVARRGGAGAGLRGRVEHESACAGAATGTNRSRTNWWVITALRGDVPQLLLDLRRQTTDVLHREFEQARVSVPRRTSQRHPGLKIVAVGHFKIINNAAPRPDGARGRPGRGAGRGRGSACWPRQSSDRSTQRENGQPARSGHIAAGRAVSCAARAARQTRHTPSTARATIDARTTATRVNLDLPLSSMGRGPGLLSPGAFGRHRPGRHQRASRGCPVAVLRRGSVAVVDLLRMRGRDRRSRCRATISSSARTPHVVRQPHGSGGDALLSLSRATLARRLDRIAPPGPVLDAWVPATAPWFEPCGRVDGVRSGAGRGR